MGQYRKSAVKEAKASASSGAAAPVRLELDLAPDATHHRRNAGEHPAFPRIS